MAREQLQYLTEPMYYILLSLTVPRHGYEIMQYITELTRGRVKVGAGTLYALLGRFCEEFIIQQLSDDGVRKTYILTDHGMEVLQNEYERLQQLVADGAAILEGEE